MDEASVHGAGDCRRQSYQDHICLSFCDCRACPVKTILESTSENFRRPSNVSKKIARKNMLCGGRLGELARRQLRKRRLSWKVKGALKTEFCPLKGAFATYSSTTAFSKVPSGQLSKVPCKRIFAGSGALQDRVTVLTSDLCAPPQALHRSWICPQDLFSRGQWSTSGRLDLHIN